MSFRLFILVAMERPLEKLWMSAFVGITSIKNKPDTTQIQITLFLIQSQSMSSILTLPPPVEHSTSGGCSQPDGYPLLGWPLPSESKSTPPHSHAPAPSQLQSSPSTAPAHRQGSSSISSDVPSGTPCETCGRKGSPPGTYSQAKHRSG